MQINNCFKRKKLDIGAIRRGCGIVLLLITFTSKAQVTLKYAIEKAGINNGLLKVESYNVILAETDIITARLRFNPLFNNQDLQSVSPRNFADHSRFYNSANRQTWFQLTSRFQVAGQRRYKIELAKKNYETSIYSYEDFKRNLYMDVANKWLDAWFAGMNYNLTVETKKNIDSLLQIFENRLKNGVIAEIDYSRVKILSQKYKLLEREDKLIYLQELNNLKLLMGTPYDSMSIDINDSFWNIENLENVDSLITYALIERSDMRMAKSINEATEKNLSLQKSLAYPIPEVGVIYNPQNFPPTTNIYKYFGPYSTLPLPIFDRNQGNIQKSIVYKRQSDLILIAKQSRIKKEIMAAYQFLETEKEVLKLAQSTIYDSENVLKNIQYSYQRGGVSFVDFLEAQRTFFTLQKNYFQSLVEYRKKYIALLYVTGLLNKL